MVSHRLWVKLSGDKVGKKRVGARLLGSYLLNTQYLVRHLAESTGDLPEKRGKLRQRRWEDLKLLFTEFKGGSVEVCLTFPEQEQPLEGPEPVMNTLEVMFATLGEIKDPSEEQGKAAFQETHPEQEKRIRILRDLKWIWPRYSGLEAAFSAERDGDLVYDVSLDRVYHERIPRWLNAELKELSRSVMGVITRARLDGPVQYFSLLDEANNVIKCEFKQGERPDLEETAINYLKKPVKLTGIIEEGRTRKLKEIIDIEEINELAMKPARFPYLKKPLELALTYEDGMFVGRNEELAITAVAETIPEIYDEFWLMVEALVASILRMDDSKLGDQALNVKKTLKEYLSGEITENSGYEFRFL